MNIMVIIKIFNIFLLNFYKMISIPKKIQKILIVIITVYLLVFVCVNLIKTEYNDPPYNYLSKNWLNSPIKNIKISSTFSGEKINEYNNQKNLGFFKQNSDEKDLKKFMNNYFNIELYKPYYYPNFVGYFHNQDGKKKCGKDSNGNIMYFPKDVECPINYIAINNYNTIDLPLTMKNIFWPNNDSLIQTDSNCNNLNIKCNYQKLNDNYYLVTSNEYINGEIVTQLRINYNNKICADSSIDLTFNDFISDDSEKKECSKDSGYDLTYHVIGEENFKEFLNNNEIKNINVKDEDKIFLSYRSYFGVDDFEKFNEHPVDHVTYAKKIAFYKNLIILICIIYYIFCSIFILYKNDNQNYNFTIKVIFIIYCVLFLFNFLFDFHVIFTFIRVKGIVKTVNLEGVKKYGNGIRWFIAIDILILLGIFFDFILKLLQFLMFKKNGLVKVEAIEAKLKEANQYN